MRAQTPDRLLVLRASAIDVLVRIAYAGLGSLITLLVVALVMLSTLDRAHAALVSTQGIVIVQAVDGAVRSDGPCVMTRGTLELDPSVVTLSIDCAAIFSGGFED